MSREALVGLMGRVAQRAAEQAGRQRAELEAKLAELVAQRDDAMGRLETCSKQLLSAREELAVKSQDLRLLQQSQQGDADSAHGGQCDGCELVDGADGAVRSYDLCESCWMRLAPGCRRVTVTEDEASGDEEDW